MTNEIPSSGGKQQASLPPEFNDVEHFQSVARNYLNREILQDFHDLGDETWQPHIGTSRASMRVALTHKDDDSLLLTHGRMMLYYMTYRKAQDLQAPIYQTPYIYDNISRKFKPQITLYFRENYTNENQGQHLVQGELSFRLIHKDSETITESDINHYAHKINTLFGANSGFIWHKGKICCSYIDKDKGYQSHILCRDKSEGRRVIEQLLDVQGHTPDWKYMYVSENEEPGERYPNKPSTVKILNKIEKKPTFRPIAAVTFKRAYILIWGKGKPITLVDKTGKYQTAVIKA